MRVNRYAAASQRRCAAGYGAIGCTGGTAQARVGGCAEQEHCHGVSLLSVEQTAQPSSASCHRERGTSREVSDGELKTIAASDILNDIEPAQVATAGGRSQTDANSVSG